MSRSDRLLQVVFVAGLIVAFCLWPLLHSAMPAVVFGLGFIALSFIVLPAPSPDPRWFKIGFMERRMAPYPRWVPAYGFIILLFASVWGVPGAADVPAYVLIPLGLILAAAMYSLIGWWIQHFPEGDEDALT